MAQHTNIEWCDSTINPTMGCDGCELWNPKAGVKACYAGTLTERYGGGKGWPVKFEQPVSFVERIEAALRWPDLTGTARLDKPWLDGQPRMIFVGDMGDTFTESLSVDLLLPYVERMAASPHVWQILTKRPKRMAEFFKLAGGVPRNLWPGTTVTSQKTMVRAFDLIQIEDASLLWISAEPLLGPLDFWFDSEVGILSLLHPYTFFTDNEKPTPHIGWVIGGFESGPNARVGQERWARGLLDACENAGVPFFWKQNGGVQKHKTGRLLLGYERNGFPDVAAVLPS